MTADIRSAQFTTSYTRRSSCYSVILIGGAVITCLDVDVDTWRSMQDCLITSIHSPGVPC